MTLSRYFLIVAAGTAGILLAGMLVRRALRAARSRPAMLGDLAWLVLFLGSGRMPPPPPPSQIEQEHNEKKNREAARKLPEG